MKLLRNMLDRVGDMCSEKGKFPWLYPLYEATDSFFYTSDSVTTTGPQARDALDLKRMMSVVVFALGPCILMAMYNSGYQANLAMSKEGAVVIETWRHAIVQALGLGFDPNNLLACLIHGALYFIPVLIVSYAVGGLWEVLFATVRKHEVNEGFFVTGMLFPLILPPTIPLWQVAIGISFGVVIGKEIFGGTGMNILNPALTARAFLFFAYPAEISGDLVWVAGGVDGLSGATMLSQAFVGGKAALLAGDYSWMQSFLGTIPGSMGETSALACLLGGVILLVTRVGSWRTMAGTVAGTIVLTLLLNSVADKVTNPMFEVPFWWHMTMGGWAFGLVFMTTDPVTAAFTNTGKYIYGFLIGALVILIRVVNPAFPEGMMLAILLMNVFAATIDHFVVQQNIKRRWARNAAA